MRSPRERRDPPMNAAAEWESRVLSDLFPSLFKEAGIVLDAIHPAEEPKNDGFTHAKPTQRIEPRFPLVTWFPQVRRIRSSSRSSVTFARKQLSVHKVQKWQQVHQCADSVDKSQPMNIPFKESYKPSFFVYLIDVVLILFHSTSEQPCNLLYCNERWASNVKTLKQKLSIQAAL